MQVHGGAPTNLYEISSASSFDKHSADKHASLVKRGNLRRQLQSIGDGQWIDMLSTDTHCETRS